MRSLLSALAVFCLLLPAAACRAQGSTSDASVPDPRLSNKLTLSETRVSVEELLRKASELSGVVLQPSSQKRYWKVREMPVSVYVKDVTVREFQAQLSKLLDLQWARAGEEGKWTYTLWQVAGARSREEAAAKAAENEQTSRVVQGWRNVQDGLAKLSQMSPSELAEAAAKDPLVKFATQDPVGRPYTQILSGLGPAAIESINAGQDLRVPFGRLSPDVQQSVRDFSGSLRSFIGKMGERDGGQEWDASGVDWQGVTVAVKPLPEGVGRTGMVPGGFMGILEIQGGGLRGLGQLPVLDPSSDFAKMMAQAVVRVNAGEDPNTVFQQMGQNLQEVMQRGGQSGKKDDAAAEDESKTDPRLLKEVDIKPSEASDVGGSVSELLEKAELNILAEAWKMPGATGSPQKGSAKKVLDTTTARFRCDWEFENGSVRIRAKDWAARRAAMVPKADIDYWKDLAQTNGKLGIDDMVTIANTYTAEQLTEMMVAEQTLARYVSPLMQPERRQAYQLHGLMGEAGIRAAGSENGMPAVNVSQAQGDMLVSILDARGINPHEVFVPGSVLYLRSMEGTTKFIVNYPPDKSIEITVHRDQQAAPPPPKKEKPDEQPAR